MAKKYGGRLENWSYTNYHSTGRETFYGNLYDDPSKRWEDGCSIHTSLVVHWDKETNQIETLNSIYDLGKERVLVTTKLEG